MCIFINSKLVVHTIDNDLDTEYTAINKIKQDNNKSLP